MTMGFRGPTVGGKSSILVMTSATAVTAMANVAPVIREAVTKPSLFTVASSSTGGMEPTPAGFSGLTGTDLFVGDIRTVIDPDCVLQKVYVPKWNVANRSCLDDSVREKMKLKAVVKDKEMLLQAKGKEIDDLKAQLLVKEAEATKSIHLRAEASKFEAIEKSSCDELKLLKERNAALEEEKGLLDVKVADLAATVKVREQKDVDSDAMARGSEISAAGLQEKEKFYPHLLTTIAGHRWLLTHGMEIALAKCLNSTEYMSALGAAIGKAIEKGMQDGLSAGIVHGVEGRTLTDIAAYNTSTEADYRAALHHLQHVEFSLLVELKSNKDASNETVMNLLRLEDNLADRLGLTGSQSSVDELMVPIHHSLDHFIVGASALSLSLDVSNFRIQKIKENLAYHVSELRDMFVPLSEPLSTAALIGTEGTLTIIPAPTGTTTSLTITLASASIIPPISTDDYGIVHADGQRNDGTDDNVDGNVDSFLNVDDVDLNP
ncbi:hypothetical protein Tco_0578985 [Tanacetum coccineum]